jgi:tetratricopeptide (TPR) repeat protein
VAKKLIILCRKNGLWHDFQELQTIFKDKINDYINPEDLSNIALFLSKGFYQQKKYYKAQSSAKRALKFDPNSINAQELLLKSWIKLGLRFCVAKKIKKLFSKTPSYRLVKIYLFNYRKVSKQKQIKLLEKLLNKSNDLALNNFILAQTYFGIGDSDQAMKFLNIITHEQLNEKNKTRFAWLKNKINNQKK